MAQYVRSLKLLLVLLALVVFSYVATGGRTSAAAGEKPTPEPTTQEQPFSPANTRTEDGKLIPADQFFTAGRCASCHKDTHAAWSESLHRNAGREPFYKESVDILERTRGSKAAQHCEACHAPVAVLSGALLRGQEARPMQDEGVTCSVCHSITEARLDGTGSYTIRRPALLAKADGTPVLGDVPDAAIMANVAGHRRAVMRPLLQTPEFCATCHKSTAPPELNNYKFIRGFSAYDEWQQSGASLDTVAPYYKRDDRTDCRACHMPKVDSANDLGAKDGLLASHRWLGANTTTPLFYGQTKQAELTEEFLKRKVLSVDIFGLRDEGTGRLTGPLDQAAANRVALQPGAEVTAEVVVFNRKAAHSFPPELRDMYEPWVEFEAIDAAGKTIFRSGFIKPDGTLDESAHVYKAVLLDENARAITRHQVWLAKVKAYDNAIPSGRADIARFRFRVPKDFGGPGGLTLRARVNYRRFIQEYTDYVLSRQGKAHLDIPVVRMAEAEVKLEGPNAAVGKRAARPAAATPKPEEQARRWNDYAIGLLEQAQYGPAAEAFRRAAELNPTDPNYPTSAAVAEMRSERFAPEREQFHKAEELLEEVLKLDPANARARFYRALVWRGMGRAREAADELAQVAASFPRDREVQRQLGQTLYGLGQLSAARAAFETLLDIDPTDAGAYQFLSPLYRSEGLTADADRARALYLLWRDDPLTDPIAARFFAANPQWADERITAHAHGADAPPRPVMTGPLAAPVR